MTDDELKRLYDFYVEVKNEYENGNVSFTGIFGEDHVGESSLSLVLFGKHSLKENCRRCGSYFEVTSGGGSDVYYCPVYQIKKP